MYPMLLGITDADAVVIAAFLGLLGVLGGLWGQQRRNGRSLAAIKHEVQVNGGRNDPPTLRDIQGDVRETQRTMAGAIFELETKVINILAGLDKLGSENVRLVTMLAPLPVVVMSGVDRRIVIANERAEKMLGWEHGWLLDQPLEVLVPERFRGVHEFHVGDFLRDPQARSMAAGRELMVLHKDGTEIPVRVGLIPVTHDDETLVVVHMSRRKPE